MSAADVRRRIINWTSLLCRHRQAAASLDNNGGRPTSAAEDVLLSLLRLWGRLEDSVAAAPAAATTARVTITVELRSPGRVLQVAERKHQ